MSNSKSLVVVLLCAVAWAADERVAVPPGAGAARLVSLTASEIKQKSMIWVQADPNQIYVTVIAPNGKRWTSNDYRDTAPIQIQVADAGSGSSDEVMSARMLGSNATLITWKETAAPGTFQLRLAGINLATTVEVVVRRMTMDEFGEEIKRHQQDVMNGLLAVPEVRKNLDSQGRGTLSLGQRNWDKDEAVLVGTTLARSFVATVQFADGSRITESNATQMGCRWRMNSGSMPPFQLAVICPARMQAGTITVTVDAGVQNQPGEMVVAVLSGQKLASAIEADSNRENPWQTLQLVPVNAEGESGFAKVAEGRAVQLAVTTMGGSEKVDVITVKAQAFFIDPKTNPPYEVLSPHPSLISVGTAQEAKRNANGSFSYSFTPGKPGRFHVEFNAEGTFANGRRFEARTWIRVSSLRLDGTVTAVRQQRLDRDNNGKADLAQFLVSVDIRQAGHYEAVLSVGNSTNLPRARMDRDLAAGKHVITLEGDQEFLSFLERRPRTQLTLRMTNLNMRVNDEMPGIVSIDTELPKAGEFAMVNPTRRDTLASGSGWSLIDTDGNGVPDRLAISTVVEGEGTNCNWRALLEVDPKIPAGTIRTLGYPQKGSFVLTAGKAKIDTIWELGPFVAARSKGNRAFVFRMTNARCGENIMRFDPTMNFTADLSAMELARGRTSIGTGEMPRISGPVRLEPLDKDRNGKYDHLKASFDLISPGGACVWNAGLMVESDNQGDGETFGTAVVRRDRELPKHWSGYPKDATAVTKQGSNRVSMELDVETMFSLREHPNFRFVVNFIKCGAQPELARRERVEALSRLEPVYDQEFVVRADQFATMRIPPPPVKPRVQIESYVSGAHLAMSGYDLSPPATTRHGIQIAIKVSDGLQRVGIVEKATAQVYYAGFSLMSSPASGPMPGKTASGPVIPMKPIGSGAYAFQFMQPVAGTYIVDFEVTGKLQNQGPFKESYIMFVQVSPEDLRVVSVEQSENKPAGPIARIVIESAFDGEIEIDAGLWNEKSLERITPIHDGFPPRMRVTKGTQTVTAQLPKEALQLAGSNILVGFIIRPAQNPVIDAERDHGVTYWDPGAAKWSGSRMGVLSLALKP